MAIQVNRVQKAEHHTKWNTTHQFNQTGSIAELPYWRAPWILGDLGKIRGWLEGLSYSAISGHLEFVLHEGFTTANGEITIYDMKTQYCIELLVQEMNRIIHGIASQFPKTELRISVAYNTIWS